MSDPEDPFRIEEDDDDRAADERRREERAAVRPEDDGRWDAGDETTTDEGEVDERTFAEKQGTAIDVVAGQREPPPGWPAEALGFPLRRPGPVTILGGAALWALLDGICLIESVGFAGYLLKLVVVPLFLRWQIHVAAMTAGGHDRPAGWLSAMDMDREQVMAVLRLVVIAVALLLPGLAAQWLDRPVLAIGLWIIASLGLAAGALGLAVGDPRLIWPWNGLLWIGRHPLGMATATLGWWAAGLIEVAVPTLRGTGVGLLIAACLGLRIAFLYVWLLSARALGVVGRSWSPFK